MCIDPDAVEGAADVEAKAATKPSRSPEPNAQEAIVVRNPVVEEASTPAEEDADSTTSEDAPRGAVFDDILSHSQARMLESIAALGRNVDLLMSRTLVTLPGSRDKSKARIHLDEEGGEIL